MLFGGLRRRDQVCCNFHYLDDVCGTLNNNEFETFYRYAPASHDAVQTLWQWPTVGTSHNVICQNGSTVREELIL